MNERIRKLWDQSRYPSGRGHDEEKFAELVRADEREACAKVCDGWTNADGDRCAEAIRSRGEA